MIKRKMNSGGPPLLGWEFFKESARIATDEEAKRQWTNLT